VRLSGIIRDHLDSLLHPSARQNLMTSARHRAFIGPRLLGSLAVLATLPIYLAVRGAPQEIEVMVFAWLIAPILVSYYLSRTGHYERAHIISSTALAAVVMAVCVTTGGISFRSTRRCRPRGALLLSPSCWRSAVRWASS